jgi:hypothetical protein
MGTVAGVHGLFNTTEFTDAVQPGEATIPVPADGTLVTDTTTMAVYVMAGGAPVYLSTWAVFGGPKATIPVSHDQLTSWPVYPRDGTFLVTPGSGAVYRIAGGAPVYVSSWAVFGGRKPTVTIDPAAVARAGSGSYFNHLSVLPEDGTYVRTPNNGAVYRLAGGAPLYVASWAPLGGPQRTVDIDPQAVAHGGQPGWWAHLLRYPVTPTYLQGAGAPAIYQVINGTATHLLSWSTVGGRRPFTVVHPLAISRAGTGGFFNHLR